jgi:hypothetical protein
LQEQSDSGAEGIAVLSEGQDETILIVTAKGTQGGEIVVVHNGACSSVDESSSSMAGAIDDSGKSRAQVELSLTTLTDGNHSIAILGGESEDVVACGNIPKSA